MLFCWMECQLITLLKEMSIVWYLLLCVTAGKTQCSSHAEKLLKVLSEMLEHEDQEVHYIIITSFMNNYTLYSTSLSFYCHNRFGPM